MRYTKKSKALKLHDAKKLPDFHDTEELIFYIRPEEAGVEHFEVHAKCDSYVGCDRVLPFKIKVEKMGKRQRDEIEKELDKGKRQGLDIEEEEEEEEEVPKWYYLGYSSFFEMVASLIILFVLGCFVVNFLKSRGYWDVYFQPVIDKYVDPVLSRFVTPWFNPIWAYISERIVVDPDEFHEDL